MFVKKRKPLLDMLTFMKIYRPQNLSIVIHLYIDVEPNFLIRKDVVVVSRPSCFETASFMKLLANPYAGFWAITRYYSIAEVLG